MKQARKFFSKLRAFGPYLVVGLIVPGGSLIALAMWLNNHRPGRTTQ